MIKFKNNINKINFLYMKKLYGDICNENNISSFSSWNIKKTFKEEKELSKGYLTQIINQYIEINYEYTNKFINNLKKIIKRCKIDLIDLDAQELRLLEERVFSIERHIKILPTNFHIHKKENVGIKFTDANLFYKSNKLKLMGNGILLISNLRIIFISESGEFIFKWHNLRNLQYLHEGFSFTKSTSKYILSIHDNETLNNTIKNYKTKINVN